MSDFKGKRILIIGGTGSLGQTLVQRLHQSNEIFVMSRDEAKQWAMQNRFFNAPIRYIIADIRNYDALRAALVDIKPQIVINASAMKQVPACEIAPHESILTNISGVQNLVRICSHDIQPEIVLGVSTDKACKPINVYGMCKAIGERIYSSANTENSATCFLCVRYGNVLESRGSIIPLFKYQARTDKTYTVTTAEMTRFFTTLSESVDLILKALAVGKKGDTFVPKLRSGKIADLADIFVEKYGGKASIIGIRPGEKVHEELIGEEEFRRTYELTEDYLVIKPMLSRSLPRYDLSYTSDGKLIKPSNLNRLASDMVVMDKKTLREFLESRQVFDSTTDPLMDEEVKF